MCGHMHGTLLCTVRTCGKAFLALLETTSGFVLSGMYGACRLYGHVGFSDGVTTRILLLWCVCTDFPVSITRASSK